MARKIIFAASLLVMFLVHIAGCSHAPSSTKTGFSHNGNALTGRLILPQGPGPHPAVVFVHGDGDMVWDAYGYYAPLIRSLNEAGFAIYSWDKPGVAGSTGNWLHQSMQDRADEVLAAVAMLRGHSAIESNSIGLLGFSQAGWVMPSALARDENLAFMVSVSGAINWLDQSAYMTRNRLRLDGASESEIQQALLWDQGLAELLGSDASFEEYSAWMRDAPSCCKALMSEDRWTFAKLNYRSDATVDLGNVGVPVLALFGDKDMNVDFAESAEVYHRILSRTPGAVKVEILSDADHSLLPALEDRLVTLGPALTQRVIAIEVFGADAFAGDAIQLITQWTSNLEGISAREVGTAKHSEADLHE